MILFFRNSTLVYGLESKTQLDAQAISKLEWLFSGAVLLESDSDDGLYIGPRREMITPWSTNAVEITQNMGIEGIIRIEEFTPVSSEDAPYDKMLNRLYKGIDQSIYKVDATPKPVIFIDNIEVYNAEQGLALNQDEIDYLKELSEKIGRKLTDSEVFGFSQVNSEHCRHKIFNGQFVIDGVEKPDTLFGLIKKTTKANPRTVVSAYKDNCAFMEGGVVEQFAPKTHDKPDYYNTSFYESVVSLKAETHNFPTTVEPFNGAATGTGGEIRDRIAGGKGAFPVAGTAIYMTSYPRMEGGKAWEGTDPRKWLYQSPKDILIKASNGASDFGNKFGQPLICGSLLTFEHSENGKDFGYDKVIMLAGGVGYGKKVDSLKDEPVKGDKVVLLGGENYRIGMGGSAVSSVATGEYSGSIELNAIQRSNPEMQKRAYNAIRAISEEDNNPIISIHDHGAGGHLNCLSELVEATGGKINLDALPVGDPTLSAKELVGNESQERMGLVIKEANIARLQAIADRERSPMYVIGEATGDMQFTFEDSKTGETPIDVKLEDLFGNSPRTVLTDTTIEEHYTSPNYEKDKITEYISSVLKLESVACKDWLTNKVDRSVTGRIVMQQCAGEVQLPLNDCGIIALDYHGERGMATALGHAPMAAMASAPNGTVLAIAESLTNLVFAQIEGGLKNVSLSANWMWPCKNAGEDARLYSAVEAASEFALELGINIPTGKDSLSMTQKYSDGKLVYAPGTVIITSSGAVADVKKCVKAAMIPTESQMVYIDFSKDKFLLGGSSLNQTLSKIGDDVPTVTDPSYFKKAFNAIQALLENKQILAGHDISEGGLITALLEMTFANNKTGLNLKLDSLGENDTTKVLFSERPSVLIQVADGKSVCDTLALAGVEAHIIGEVTLSRECIITNGGTSLNLSIDTLRDVWYRPSYLLDACQSTEKLAAQRFESYAKQPLEYTFPTDFTGKLSAYGINPRRKEITGIKAAIIREKGSNGEREMAWAMHLAGMDVKDVHMTDLISGRETLEDINLIVFVGGFSNSDVLNSAKGWAGAFLYNEKAKAALDNFYARDNTLSLGVCNGCQLLIELGLIHPTHENKPKMLHNDSHKFESGFVGVSIESSPAVMLKSLEGSKLGVWIAHGEGKFNLPMAEREYRVAMKYSYAEYPANPNGSDYNVAGICSKDGRHLAMMPHPERCLRSWNWAYYPQERMNDEITPWIEMFVNAKEWIKSKK